MIHAGEQRPWRGLMQVFSKNNKTSGGKCYEFGLNPEPSNAQDQKRAGDHDRCRIPPYPSSVS